MKSPNRFYNSRPLAELWGLSLAGSNSIAVRTYMSLNAHWLPYKIHATLYCHKCLQTVLAHHEFMLFHHEVKVLNKIWLPAYLPWYWYLHSVATNFHRIWFISLKYVRSRKFVLDYSRYLLLTTFYSRFPSLRVLRVSEKLGDLAMIIHFMGFCILLLYNFLITVIFNLGTYEL